MGIAQTTRVLAEAVQNHLHPTEPRHVLVLELLRLMPLYLDFRDLAAWDRACLEVIGEETSEVDRLLSSIYDFATTNLYAAIHPKYTRDAYQEVLGAFARHRVPAPILPADALDDW